MKDRIALFWSKVQETATCWYWMSQKNSKGYGRFWDGSRSVQAHRFAYEAVVGPIPEGLQLDHLCRVRHCVNPAHLEPVTARENLLRGDTLPAMYVKRTACGNGHPYTAESLYIHTDEKGRKARMCRDCLHERRARNRLLITESGQSDYREDGGRQGDWVLRHSVDPRGQSDGG